MGNRHIQSHLLIFFINLIDFYMTKKILRLPQVKQITGLSRSSIYEFMNKGFFPKSISLNNNGRAIGWLQSDIENWIDSRIKSQSEKQC
jgi:prophage regulatory protein